jgi:hypothetical protein
VSSPANNGILNRRALLLGAVFLVGGAAALSRFARKLPGTQTPSAFSPEQFALLEQVSEVLVPATDTPGAIAAGVPAFMSQVLDEWGAPDTRAAMRGVIDRIEKLAWTQFGAGFLALAAEQRHELLKVFDEQALARLDPAYGKFKYLVLLGYYHSEIGATQELRYELVPGAWRACLPLSEIGRASAI